METELKQPAPKRNKSKSSAPDKDGPCELNTKEHPHFIEVSSDKLQVVYVGAGNHSNDFGSIRSAEPVPSGTFIYYFEVEILDNGIRGDIGVGVSQAAFNLNMQVGCEGGSYAYGADGQKFHNSGRGTRYGETFGDRDVIGCGMNFHSQEIFFTKNGKNIGTAFNLVQGQFYPTCSLHSAGEKVKFNFGKSAFKFDVGSMRADERRKMRRIVSATDLDTSLVAPLIRQYLLHSGYHDTLKILDEKHKWSQEFKQQDKAYESLHARKIIRDYIINGNIDAAVEEINKLCPELLKTKRRILVTMHCQKFIELVRSQNMEAALKCAQDVLCKYKDADNHELLQNVVGLLAYPNVQDSPVAHLLERNHREFIADTINSAILNTFSIETLSSLSNLMLQLMASHEMLLEDNFDMGEPLSLDDD